MPGPAISPRPGHTGNSYPDYKQEYYSQQHQKQEYSYDPPFAYDNHTNTAISTTPRYPSSSSTPTVYNNNINLNPINDHQYSYASPASSYHNSNSNNNYYNSNTGNNTSSGLKRQPTHQQYPQLQPQKQHQQHAVAENSLRQPLQQDSQHRNYDPYPHRTPRVPPAVASANVHSPGEQDPTNAESKPKAPPSYCYPPQPSSRPSSPDPDDHGPFISRIKQLFKFPSSTYGKSMVLVIAVEALLVIIMQAIIVGLYFHSLVDTPLPPPTSGLYANITMPPYLDTRNQSRSIPAYLIVFVFAQLFQLVFAWDAVRAQNTIELIGIVIFNLCCFAYSIFEISQIRNSLWDSGNEGFFVPQDKAQKLQDSIQPFLIIVVCIIGITQFLVTWLAYRLFQEFGWKIYKKIGADPNTKKMYRAYQIYLVLIKVDLFFFVGFSIQFIYLTLIKRGQDPEYWLTIIVLPVTILILYIAVYAVRHESRKWMATFLLAMLCGVVYFIFKVVRMYIGPKVENYRGVFKFLTLFASLCLITILLTIANAAFCYRNFGKGLKPHLQQDGPEAQSVTSPAGARHLEID
ncbi:hypothetical protein BGZ54_002287 [Gamsiella multidivaricata]|nr:hypothetical protein BGZ54_002287 [Gamsiella multidivaricata]